MRWPFVGRQDELESLCDAVASGRSILIVGASGVGKSRLADETRRQLEDSFAVDTLKGSPGMRKLRFAAVSHLVGDAPLSEPSALIALATRTIRRRAQPRKVVVIVDDIDQLDDGSFAVVESLLTDGSIPVVATARTEESADPRILRLWKDELIERVDIEPLLQSETELLTTSILGGQCAGSLTSSVWRLTEGHPLFVRELLFEAIDQGDIALRDGVWQLVGSLGRSTRVADIVRARTDHLEDAELEGLRTVALCEPISPDLARLVIPAQVLATLESKQMIRAERTDTGLVIRTTHPLIREVSINQLLHIERSAAEARLAKILINASSIPPDVAVRASIWLLDAGEMPPQHIALYGARAALRAFDPILATRLAKAALSQGPVHEALVVLGRSHAAIGDSARAIEVLTEAIASAGSETQQAAVATAMAEVQMFHLANAPAAAQELSSALDSLHEPGPRAEVSSHLIMAAGVVGDFDLGLRIGVEIADRTDLPEPAQLGALMATTLAQSMTGKLDQVNERLERIGLLARRLADTNPHAADQADLNHVLVQLTKADLISADDFARQAIERNEMLLGAWLFLRAMSREFTGSLGLCQSLTLQSMAALAESDPLGMALMAQGMHAMYLAMSGRSSEASTHIAAVRSDERSQWPRNAIWADRAEAWALAHAGELSAAADHARSAGERAVDGTHYVWGGLALHDAVRFDRPEVVANLLGALNSDGRGPLIELLAKHADAAANADLQALDSIGRRFHVIGAISLAGVCFATAARFAEEPQRTRFSHLASEYRLRCDVPPSPMLSAVKPPLTKRQREVASLAASGLRSKDIAAQLHLSTRTIGNHLGSVYGILEIEGRPGLTAMFPDPVAWND